MKSKSKLVNVTRQKDSLTHNGAITNSTSLNSVVDLFFLAGASRNMSEEDIRNIVQKAYVEDALLTVKCIFWAGNVRGGAGERRFLRIALKFLEDNYKDTLLVNLHLVPFFSRWDNLFHLESEEVLPLVYDALTQCEDRLCAKWMPRKKQYNNFADKFKKKYNLSPKEYRHLIVDLSKTVEQQMCNKDFKSIKYSEVPSVAMNKYRTAFYRNDESRFTQFIDAVNNGEEKINAGVLFPYQLYQAFNKGDNPDAIEAQWNALPNYLEGNPERILPICDVSGSMTGLPMDVSVSLGLYLSEKNESVFKDAFITFSGTPKMQYLQGSVVERMNQLRHAEWGMNTNIQATFDLVLARGLQEGLTQEDMPTMLLIISDMEFDSATRGGHWGEPSISKTNFGVIKEKYEASGYKMPKLVFWNVNGRIGNCPVSYDESGTALISGCSPSIMKAFLEGKNITPESVVLEVLNSEEYNEIKLA